MNKTLLKACHLSKTYKTDEKPFHALYEVDLEVVEGDIFGIIGQSGAGKSTLLRILSTLEAPSSGNVFFEGVDLFQLQSEALRHMRKNIGMVFQHFQLFSSRTTAENIAFPLEMAGVDRSTITKKVNELLDAVGLTEQKNVYPAFLSGGQKQRVGIARALSTNPKLLFCDEATSALDPIATKHILLLLKRLHEQFAITILLITHEMDVIRQLCHKVAVLSHGQIIECKPTIDLFFAPNREETKTLLQKTVHLIPQETKNLDNAKRIRLSFRGKTAKEPIISTMIRKFDIDANILAGWIDEIQNETIGTLILELTGKPSSINEALIFLSTYAIRIEELPRNSL